MLKRIERPPARDRIRWCADERPIVVAVRIDDCAVVAVVGPILQFVEVPALVEDKDLREVVRAASDRLVGEATEGIAHLLGGGRQRARRGGGHRRAHRCRDENGGEEGPVHGFTGGFDGDE